MKGWSWLAIISLVFVGSFCLFVFTKDFSTQNEKRGIRKMSDSFFTIVKVILFASIGKLPKVAAANVSNFFNVLRGLELILFLCY